MRRHPWYIGFGLLVIAAMGLAEASGFGASRATEVRNVPRSVRDNPGAYRSVYIGRTGRYMRGK